LRCAAFAARLAKKRCPPAQPHPAFPLAPAALLTARAAGTSLATTQGAQISLGALLMTVVGGGSPGVAAANPGLSKWLNGAIGLPVVRTGPVGRGACAALSSGRARRG
jgi:hypothetical protein